MSEYISEAENMKVEVEVVMQKNDSKNTSRILKRIIMKKRRLTALVCRAENTA